MALAPLATLNVMVLLLMAAAMGGFFSQMHTALVVLGCVLGAVSCAPFPLRVLMPWRGKDLCVPLALVLVLLCLSVHYADIRMVYWDEFFWGGFVKQLLHENALWNWNTALPRRDSVMLYPPTMTILHALFMPQGVFSETAVALGGLVSTITLGFVLYHTVRTRLSWPHASLMALTLCLLARIMGSKVGYLPYYLSGYAENTQIALTTALLCIIIFEPVQKHVRISLLLGLPVVTLCKPTGFILATIVLVCLAVRHWLAAPETRRYSACIRNMALPTLAAGAAWKTWDIYVQTHIRIPSGDTLSQTVLLHSPDYVVECATAFINAFMTRSLLGSPWLGPTPLASAAAACLLLCFLLRPVRHDLAPRRYVWCVRLLFLGFAGWLATHFLVALLFFHEEEALRAASFERYTGAYIAILLMVTLCVRVRVRPAHARTWHVTLGSFLALLMLSMFPPSAALQKSTSPRSQMEKAAEVLAAHTPPHTQYWLVDMGSDGEAPMALVFLTLPARSMAQVTARASFNNVNSPETLLTAGQLPENLRELARDRGADYLLLWRYDKAFAERYASLLGLTQNAGPQLLDLRAWRNGQSPFPRAVPLP